MRSRCIASKDRRDTCDLTPNANACCHLQKLKDFHPTLEVEEVFALNLTSPQHLLVPLASTKLSLEHLSSREALAPRAGSRVFTAAQENAV